MSQEYTITVHEQLRGEVTGFYLTLVVDQSYCYHFFLYPQTVMMMSL